jgi:hypothetical protein
MASNSFDGPIPGQSLTKHPKSHPWQSPPKYTSLNDACNYVFNRITEARQARQLLAMMKSGVTLEAIVRTIIHAGFGEGLWTPDLGLLMVHPLMYQLAGIANRSNLNPKVSSTDRSGLRDLVHLKKASQTDANMGQQQPTTPITDTKKPPAGLMAPVGG